MDRQIVYPAQIPLDSDLLNAQRNAFVGLGHLAGMAYGENTVSAGGFACTPGAGLTVTIAPGSLLAAGVVDTTAYGTLAASGSVLVRQYISRDPVTLTVPGAGGTYTVYATPATVDTDDTVLPFYNAADPSVTYAGSDNSGKAAPTVRQDVAQLGIGAAVPDGAYPLWTITVPSAATAIAADMIAQAEGAPFYETIPGLQASKISKAGDGMAGPLSVLNATAAQNPVALGQLQAMGFIANALIGVTSITSSGTFTPDARTKWLRIRGVGGGGGSGGCPYTGSTQESTASGGYSGGYIELVVSVEDLLAGADSIAISIGAGGLAGTGNASGATPGGDGGDTTIGGAVTIPGGPGGHNGSWGTGSQVFSQALSTTLPTSTVGTIIAGIPPTISKNGQIVLGIGTNQQKGGDGGDTPFGQGGIGGVSRGGAIGNGYGSGGGGASQGANYEGASGAAGLPAKLIIEEYA